MGILYDVYSIHFVHLSYPCLYGDGDDGKLRGSSR